MTEKLPARGVVADEGEPSDADLPPFVATPGGGGGGGGGGSV